MRWNKVLVEAILIERIKVKVKVTQACNSCQQAQFMDPTFSHQRSQFREVCLMASFYHQFIENSFLIFQTHAIFSAKRNLNRLRVHADSIEKPSLVPSEMLLLI
jgi:hypothetical protein